MNRKTDQPSKLARPQVRRNKIEGKRTHDVCRECANQDREKKVIVLDVFIMIITIIIRLYIYPIHYHIDHKRRNTRGGE